MYGPHLIMEGYGAPSENLQNMESLYRMLDEFPGVIGMTKIMPPHVQRYKDHGNSEWGISGFVIIAESHIAIHTYPEKKFFVLDIFSCKDFSVEDAVGYARFYLKPEKCDHQLLNRGEDYPKDIDVSAQIVTDDRTMFRKAISGG